MSLGTVAPDERQASLMCPACGRICGIAVRPPDHMAGKRGMAQIFRAFDLTGMWIIDRSVAPPSSEDLMKDVARCQKCGGHHLGDAELRREASEPPLNWACDRCGGPVILTTRHLRRILNPPPGRPRPGQQPSRQRVILDTLPLADG